MDDCKGKLVFITGGSAGIGLETAKLYASRGVDVAIFARNTERLEQAKREIEAARSGSISAGAGLMKPVTVAEALLKGVEKGRFIIMPGFDGKSTWLAKRLAPGLVNRVIMRSIKKAQKGEKQ